VANVEPRSLRWSCPHCGIGRMKLTSAERHLRRKHYECNSCKLEWMLVCSLLQGRGFLSEGPSFWESWASAEQET